MIKTSKKSIEDFGERLRQQLEKMKVSSKKRECILELINMELKYPTYEKDALIRYKGILEKFSGEERRW